jgi:hypothetical protein
MATASTPAHPRAMSLVEYRFIVIDFFPMY